MTFAGLAVALALAWAASYVDGVACHRGNVLVFRADGAGADPLLGGLRGGSSALDDAGVWHALAGDCGPPWFAWHGVSVLTGDVVCVPFGSPLPVHLCLVCVPCWMCVVTAAVAAAVPSTARWLAGWRRRHRAARGVCAGCGYDLRGTPERCPECGQAAGVVAPLPPDNRSTKA